MNSVQESPRSLFNASSVILIGLTSLSCGLVVGMINYCFGMFVAAIVEDSINSDVVEGYRVPIPDAEASRTVLNGAYSFGQVVSNLVAPMTGTIIDKRGARITITACLLFVGLGFVSLCLSYSIFPSLYLSYVLMGFGLTGASMIGPAKLIGSWYSKEERGFVLGIATAGNNTFGMVFVQVGALLVRVLDWRWAAMIFAMTLLGLSLVFYTAIRDGPGPSSTVKDERGIGAENEHGETPQPIEEEIITFKDAIKMPKFYTTTAGMMFAYFTYSGVLAQIIPSLVAEGFTLEESANVVSLVGFLGVFSKLSGGRMSQSLSARTSLMISLVFQIIALLLFFTAPKLDLDASLATIQSGKVRYWIAFALYGISFGAVGALLPLTAMESFGMHHFGEIFGKMSLTFVVASLSGPIITGQSYDITSSYKSAYAIFAVVFALAIVLLGVKK